MLAGEKGWTSDAVMAQMLVVLWAMCANKRNILMRFNTNRTIIHKSVIILLHVLDCQKVSPKAPLTVNELG